MRPLATVSLSRESRFFLAVSTKTHTLFFPLEKGVGRVPLLCDRQLGCYSFPLSSPGLFSFAFMDPRPRRPYAAMPTSTWSLLSVKLPNLIGEVAVLFLPNSTLGNVVGLPVHQVIFFVKVHSY